MLQVLISPFSFCLQKRLAAGAKMVVTISKPTAPKTTISMSNLASLAGKGKGLPPGTTIQYISGPAGTQQVSRFYGCCVGTRDYAAPECSRLVNKPSSYGILTDHNAGANRERAWIAQRAQDGSYLM